MRLSADERDDILVSYITGLGPVGEPVCCHATYVRKDMGWDHQTYYAAINRLIRSRRIRRFARGMYTVLRRLESDAALWRAG